MKQYNPIKKYPYLILFGVVLFMIYRAVELYYVLTSFNNVVPFQAISQEFLGLITDFGWLTLFFLVIFSFESIFKIKSKKPAYFYLCVLLVLFIAHTALLIYFFHEQTPLGRMLFQHSWKEVSFTITTSGYSLIRIFFFVILLFAFFLFTYSRISNRFNLTFGKSAIRSISVIGFGSFALLFFGSGNLVSNKSYYFYKESIVYFFIEGDPLKNMEYEAERVKEFQSLFPKDYVDLEYPFLHKQDTTDYLGTYFDAFDTIPNIVFILVEGLNDDFIHSDNGVLLMPFLNELKEKSLYWENCFTLGERSFAVVPSILGGLPYGERSFMQLKNYPRFFSLASVLKQNDYQVSFDYGQGSWFHSKNIFFNAQNVDYIFDKEVFPKEAQKVMVNDYFWGYGDKTFFKEALKYKENHPKVPYLDVYFTGTMHSPFYTPEKEKYSQLFSQLIENSENVQTKERFEKYRNMYMTTLYTDDAIQEFISQYKTRKEFENTIFIITGDHPITEVPIKNTLKRYHVPLIIYSPKLKQGVKSKNVVSHLDVYGSINNLLRKYGVHSPTYSASLGANLKVEKNQEDRQFVFMDGNRVIREIYKDGYFYSDNQLYAVDEDFGIEKVRNKEKEKELIESLKAFKYVNLLSTHFDRLYPLDDYLLFHKLRKVYHEKEDEFFSAKDEYINLLTYKLEESEQLKIKLKLKVISKESSVVFSITDSEGNSTYWNNHGLTTDIKPGNYFEVDEIIQADAAIKNGELKIYIWNPKENEVAIKEKDILITTKKH